MRAIMLAALALVLPALVGTASADPVLCQKTIAKQYTVLKKKTLKGVAKCLDKENKGDLPGPCPDAITDGKLDVVRQKVEGKVATACSLADAAALGFSGFCNLGFPEGSAAEAACSALPVTTSAELAACITCWKQADFLEFLSLLYASHAVELCGTLGLSSTACSQGGCASLLGTTPDQRDLGDTGENDCQKGIGKAGIKYLLAREKELEKCALAGGTRTSCLDDPAVQLKLSKAEAKKQTVIQDKCGNRDPQPNLPFCCRTTGNNCVAAVDRETCITGGGDVQEGKACGVSNTCDPVGGPNQKVTWWDTCPIRSCGNFSVTTLDDLIDCIDAKADEIVDGMLCYQFPNPASGWTCPSSPSAAFLD